MMRRPSTEMGRIDNTSKSPKLRFISLLYHKSKALIYDERSIKISDNGHCIIYIAMDINAHCTCTYQDYVT